MYLASCFHSHLMALVLRRRAVLRRWKPSLLSLLDLVILHSQALCCEPQAVLFPWLLTLEVCTLGFGLVQSVHSCPSVYMCLPQAAETLQFVRQFFPTGIWFGSR